MQVDTVSGVDPSINAYKKIVCDSLIDYLKTLDITYFEDEDKFGTKSGKYSFYSFKSQYLKSLPPQINTAYLNNDDKYECAIRASTRVKAKKTEAEDKVNLSHKQFVMSHKPVFLLNDASKKDSIILVTKDFRYTNISPDVYKGYMNDLKGWREMMSVAPAAKLVYQPKNFTPVEHGVEYHKVNSYIPPKWTEVKEVSDEIDPLLIEYFKDAIPDKADRKYVFGWMKQAVFERNKVFLCLIGRQGCGKSFLANLLKYCVGVENNSAIRPQDLNARFNSFIKDKRLIFADEYQCRNKAERDNLKRISNETLAVEAKGADHQTITNHSSFILANNYNESVAIEPRDRVFSFP